MLSYRHTFHAGNHADVLKHVILIALLEYLQRKDAAVMVVDTHAGRGRYDLTDADAQQLGEADLGIGRIWAIENAPPSVQRLQGLVASTNSPGVLRSYPGSPELIHSLLRPQDRARFFELHTSDYGALAALFAKAKRRIQVRHADGLVGLKSVLPPPSRRGLVLIDPAYEDKAEYRRVVKALVEARKRFATGVFAIWYPQLAHREALRFPELIENAAGSNWLNVGIRVRADSRDGFGMTGSGMMIVNPPFTLRAELDQALPWLRDHLKQDNSASMWIRSSQGQSRSTQAAAPESPTNSVWNQANARANTNRRPASGQAWAGRNRPGRGR